MAGAGKGVFASILMHSWSCVVQAAQGCLEMQYTNLTLEANLVQEEVWQGVLSLSQKLPGVAFAIQVDAEATVAEVVATEEQRVLLQRKAAAEA